MNSPCRLCTNLKQACSNVSKPTKTPQSGPATEKQAPETEDEATDDEDAGEGEGDEDDDEDEAAVEESPKASKGKAILKSLSSPFKRKLADRSPEAPPVPSQPKSRFTLVGVFVPPPPLPYASYIQLGNRLSSTSLVPSSSSLPAAPPPLSATPSLVSFDSQDPSTSATFDADRYRALYRMSQENLVFQQAQFEEEREMTLRRQQERERRQQEQFDVERALYQSRIQELERPRQDETSRPPSSGGFSRR